MLNMKISKTHGIENDAKKTYDDRNHNKAIIDYELILCNDINFFDKAVIPSYFRLPGYAGPF